MIFSLQENLEPQPQLDLAFKEGQTIKVNINIPKSDKAKAAKGKTGGGLGILPPPPVGGIKPPPTNNNVSGIPGASSLTPLSSPVDPSQASTVIGKASSSNLDLLCDLGGLDLNKPASAPTSDDPWGDFASADNGAKTSGNWVQF